MAAAATLRQDCNAIPTLACLMHQRHCRRLLHSDITLVAYRPHVVVSVDHAVLADTPILPSSRISTGAPLSRRENLKRLGS